MRFKFSLEAVLKYRRRVEEIAQREFAEAQAAVDDCLRKIEAMYKRSDEVREDISGAQKGGKVDGVEHIREMELFLAGQKIRIATLRQHARELLQIAEEKQEALIQAAQDKKSLEKMKEKRFAEWETWLRKLEAKELDDMTTVRQGWGKK
jgi:flagellar FliJ protein